MKKLFFTILTILLISTGFNISNAKGQTMNKSQAILQQGFKGDWQDRFHESLLFSEAILHQGNKYEGDTLSSESSESLASNANDFSLDETNFNITGEIGDQPFDITADISDDELINVNETLGLYEVVSIYVYSNDVKIYLKENEDIIEFSYKYRVVAAEDDEDTLCLSYHPYWFTEVLESEPMKAAIIRPMVYNTNYTERITRSFNVWDTKYTETMDVGIFFNWPESVLRSASNEQWTTKLKVINNSTSVVEKERRKLIPNRA
ncbi:hypothetical protein [Neobacillus soli]|uniref:hypothetical protein n=1 Tax=Neobacillus soli TaxID=220688 RepID=UPI000825CB52|nr:hypothetical protein [Neobacillus soli]